MKLIICIHNHQPVGNPDHILEEACTRSYMPFFNVLKNFPTIKVNIHFSGFLFQWIKENKPDYLNLLKDLHARGQLEIVSGGMYEPIIALLPEDDAIEQIGLHLDTMEETFGVRPKGMWLAERVYEPQLPKVMARAGIQYTIVDDNHFKTIGLRENELYGYFVTEFGGERLFIFPGLEVLRYVIPFKSIEKVDECFKGIRDDGANVAIFGDDGEKFGLWPGTFDYVYDKEHWLESFFHYLTENASWLETVLFGDYIKETCPKGRVYLACASYKEMEEWCLPAPEAREYNKLLHDDDLSYRNFVKGGYYRHFLVKYSESNDMHKRMMRLSQAAKGNRDAKNHIYMAQANDSYWHGVFGGLYLPHLRGAVWHHLIEAGKLLDPKGPFVDGYIEDVNLDGHDEAVIKNNDLEATFRLKEGGILYGLDYKPSSVNIMATLMRRYEGYHEKIKEAEAQQHTADGTRTIHDMVVAKEEGLEKYLHYDWYRRGSFIDHVLGTGTTLDAFYKCEHTEPADFVREPYQAKIEKQNDSLTLILKRDGHFWQGASAFPVVIDKRIALQAGAAGLVADYRITGELNAPFLFGMEFNFSFLGTGGDRYMETENGMYGLAQHGVLDPTSSVKFHDPYQNIQIYLEFSEAAELWTFPVEVVSLSENGFERNYQSTMVMPVWQTDLSEGPRNISVKMRLAKAQ
ncbi:MAG: alpha-amylase/4-alpha-glucanotransferase domain-containing protein [Syntrophorhabdaceae bacterium]